jgi:hypothetical protein
MNSKSIGAKYRPKTKVQSPKFNQKFPEFFGGVSPLWPLTALRNKQSNPYPTPPEQ